MVDLWYHLDNQGEEGGPLTLAELRGKLQRGELSSDIFVQREGMIYWEPMPQVPELGDAHPWRRMAARKLDVFLFSVPAWLLACIYVPIPLAHFLLTIAHAGPAIRYGLFAVISMTIYFAYALYETLCLALFKTTPIRALLKIRPRKYLGRGLEFGEALTRSMQVFALGLGCGVSLCKHMAPAFWLFYLSEHGTTAWDRNVGSTMQFGDLGPGRWAAYWAIFVILCLHFWFGLQVLIAASQPHIEEFLPYLTRPRP